MTPEGLLAAIAETIQAGWKPIITPEDGRMYLQCPGDSQRGTHIVSPLIGVAEYKFRCHYGNGDMPHVARHLGLTPLAATVFLKAFDNDPRPSRRVTACRDNVLTLFALCKAEEKDPTTRG